MLKPALTFIDFLEGPNTSLIPQLKNYLDPSEKEWRKECNRAPKVGWCTQIKKE